MSAEKPEVYERRWDCRSCGRKGELGRDQKCQGCGTARPEGNEIFYDVEDSPEVTDETLLKKAAALPDWICQFCSFSTPGSSGTCANCSAPKGTSPSRKVHEYTPEHTHTRESHAPQALVHQVVPPKRETDEELQARIEHSRRTTGAERRDAALYSSERYDYRPTSKADPGISFFSMPAIAGLCLAIFMICGLYACLHTTVEQVTLTGVSWQRSINVEENMLVREEDWDVPSGGRVVGSERKIHHHVDVQVGTRTVYEEKTFKVKVGTRTEKVKTGRRKDLGNGFAEAVYEEKQVDIFKKVKKQVPHEVAVYRKDPVYRTWHTYDIWRWKSVTPVQVGGANTNPTWPDPRTGPRRRETGRSEKYLAYFTGNEPKKATYTLELPLPKWSALTVGKSYQARINGLGQLVELLTPEA